NLLLMSFFLLVPDLGRLVRVLVLNRAAPAADLNPVRFERRRVRAGVTFFWALFIGYQLFDQGSGRWTAYKERYLVPERPPLYGLYEVESGAPANWRKV